CYHGKVRERITARDDLFPACSFGWICSMSMTMRRTMIVPSGKLSLEDQGLTRLGRQHWNSSQAMLAEQALARGEGKLSDQGALVFETGKYTGRSPKDKFIVREPSSEANIDWGEVN